MSFVEVKDLTDTIGESRYIVVGDIHGCYTELTTLLDKMDVDYKTDYVISVGDLIDRGEQSLEVVKAFLDNSKFHVVYGNHDERFHRYLKGNNVKVKHGLQETIDQMKPFIMDNPNKVEDFFSNLPYIIKIHNNFVVHAGFNPYRDPYHQLRQDCIYMRYIGGESYFDNVKGKYWFEFYPKDAPNVFFGHEVILDQVNVKPYVYALDGGCVFGHSLRAYDSRDDRVHSIQAERTYSGTTTPDRDALLARSKESFKEQEI